MAGHCLDIISLNAAIGPSRSATLHCELSCMCTLGKFTEVLVRYINQADPKRQQQYNSTSVLGQPMQGQHAELTTQKSCQATLANNL